MVIRTKGHRLVGIWHSGSPMAVVLNAIRGIYVAVPRNMTQAAGFYNTLFRGDNPGLVIEVLNGYRLKERVPDNLGEFTVPLGVPEVLREGSDVTVVTYGACCAIALEAAAMLQDLGVSAEVIDVQTLNPFDVESVDREVAREDARRAVPRRGHAGRRLRLHAAAGARGAAGLVAPRLRRRARLPPSPNRPAYGPDGDYFTKPNRESDRDARLRDDARAPARAVPRAGVLESAIPRVCAQKQVIGSKYHALCIR